MIASRMLILLTAALLIAAAGLWSIAAPGFAQEASETAPAEAADEDATAGDPSAEVFIPTEEISEDFAVSFPVDI